MKKETKKILNKKGESNIALCVLFLILLMLFSLILTFASEVQVTSRLKESAKIALNNVTRSTTIDITNELKQSGDEYNDGVTQTLPAATKEFISYWCLENGMKLKNGYYVLYDGEGRELAKCSNVAVKKTKDGLAIRASFNVHLSIVFMGVPYDTIQFPINIVVSNMLDTKY